MHAQWSSTVSSENASTYENIESINSINDPIIQEMLSNRVLEEKVNENDETERQNRMYSMLVHSKKYRKLTIERANDMWHKDAKDVMLEPADQPARNELASSADVRHVHFSDKIEKIPTTRRGEIARYIRGFLRF
jgi:hypothetical protein